MGRHKPRVHRRIDPGQWHSYGWEDGSIPHFLRENRLIIECSVSGQKAKNIIEGAYPVACQSHVSRIPKIGDGFFCYCPLSILMGVRLDWQLVFRFRVPRESKSFYREMSDATRLERLIKAATGFNDETPTPIMADWLEEHGFYTSTMFMRFRADVESMRSKNLNPANGTPMLMAKRHFGR